MILAKFACLVVISFQRFDVIHEQSTKHQFITTAVNKRFTFLKSKKMQNDALFFLF